MKSAPSNTTEPQSTGSKRRKPNHQLHPENWDAEYREYLTRYAYKRVSDPQLAEDLVQEVFVAAWKSRNSFRGTASEKTWLTTVLRNKIIDFYRARGRNKTRLSVDFGPDTDDSSRDLDWLETCVADDPNHSPDKAIRRREFMGRLNHHLDGLPEKMRNAFWMREVEGHTSDEITRALDVTSSNLSTLISRAKKHLRQSFGCVAGQI